MRETPSAGPTKPLADCRATVVDAFHVTPAIRRLVFAAQGLAAAFGTPSGAHAPYLKLVLGTADGPVVRTYSIRRLDADRDELHVDFVLHEAEGPGAAFGRTARLGSTARLRGPGHLALANCSECRLAADHCGLPALSHILENLPRHASGVAVVEVPGRAEVQTLDEPSGVSLEWLIRPPGAESRLAERFAASPRPGASDALVWAGAEASAARRMRSIAKGDWRIPAQRCQILNSWREGRPEGSFSFMT